ncbi:MAG: hypothetical protein AAF333_01680 [Planctomycetota bacterium]
MNEPSPASDASPTASLDLEFAARQRLNDHLDAVEDVLRKYQQPRHARAAIVDELENQILEQLGENVGKRQATANDLESVLAELDPPEAYARNSIDLASLPSTFGFPPEEPPRFNRATAAGLIWIGWFALAVMVAGVLLFTVVSPELYSIDPFAPASDNRRVLTPAMYAYQTWWGTLTIIFLCIPGLLAPVATTLLGWLGVSQIKQSRGTEYGLGLAICAALLFPFITANLVISGGSFMFLLWVDHTIMDIGQFTAWGLIIFALLVLVLLVSLNRSLIQRAIRLANEVPSQR